MSNDVQSTQEQRYVLGAWKFRKKLLLLDISSFWLVTIISRYTVFNGDPEMIARQPELYWGGLIFFSFCIYMAFPRRIFTRKSKFDHMVHILDKHFEGDYLQLIELALKIQQEEKAESFVSKQTGKSIWVQLTFPDDTDDEQILIVKTS